jgi:hypothetical protein
MRKVFQHIAILPFILFGVKLSAQPADTLDVLFVGNSYTYFWNMPLIVETLSENADVYIKARKSTEGGVTWKDHWEGAKGLKTQERIDAEEWDIVILQNHSLSTIRDLDQFMEYGDKLIAKVQRADAEAVLYATWARDFNPLMQSDIMAGYEQLAQKHGLRNARAGEVWEDIRQLRPELELYDPDGSHPSPIGSYVNAVLFYCLLTGESAQGLPKRVIARDKYGEELYLAILSEEDAEFIHDVVDRHFANEGGND